MALTYVQLFAQMLTCRNHSACEKPELLSSPDEKRIDLVTYLLRRENLQIPIRRLVRILKDILRQERQTRPLEPRRHNHHIALHLDLHSRPPLRHPLRAPVKPDPLLRKANDIPTQPLRVPLADLAKDIRIDHRRAREQSLLRRRQIPQIAVEEDAQQALGDPREDRLRAEHVQRQQHVDNCVARDDPLVRARQHGRLRGARVQREFERFDSGRPPADDKNFFAVGVDAVQVRGMVYFAAEDVLVGEVGEFGGAAGADGGDDAVEAAMGGVVDEPAVLAVFVDGGDAGVEFGAGLQRVLFPELGDLRDDLLAVGVAGAPVQRGEESVHDAVDLEAAGVVDALVGGVSRGWFACAVRGR